VDDEPAPLRVWLPELAEVLGAKPHVGEWLGRIGVGEAGVYLARIRGLSNEKTKRELGWRFRYPNWRDGFRHGLAERPIETARAA
jgi:hypothetical protein